MCNVYVAIRNTSCFNNPKKFFPGDLVVIVCVCVCVSTCVRVCVSMLQNTCTLLCLVHCL